MSGIKTVIEGVFEEDSADQRRQNLEHGGDKK